MSLAKKTAHELHGLLKNKEICSEELTKDVLTRISKVEDRVKAFIFREKEDAALEKAKKVDQLLAEGEKLGDLAGIPLTLKDNICTKGITTTCASKMLENFIPPYNAFVAEKMGDDKTILVGKTNMDEFDIGSSTENSAFFPTKNPWNLNLVPGGSDGGGGAAVAAHETIFSLGSDQLKSAAFCGVVGLKPTFGRVSRYGIAGSTSSLEQVGPVTKDVTDSAWVLQAISGHDHRDSVSANLAVPDYKNCLTGKLIGMKVALPKEYFGQKLDQEVKDVVLKAVKHLEDLGAEVSEISMPHLTYALSAYQLIAAAEASSVLARYEGVRYGFRRDDVQDIEALYRTSRSEGFGKAVKRRIILGTHVLSQNQIEMYYIKALKIRTLIKKDFDKAFEKYDLIVGPTCPRVAFEFGELSDDLLNSMGLYTVPAHLAGLPAISLPCGLSQGMPVGLLMTGQSFGEEKLLRAAFAYEQSSKFINSKPNLLGEED